MSQLQRLTVQFGACLPAKSIQTAGVEKVLLLVSPERRQSLLGAVTSLLQRLSSKSPTKLAALHFIEALFASPATYMQNGADPAVSEQDACFWIQVSIKILAKLLVQSELEFPATKINDSLQACRQSSSKACFIFSHRVSSKASCGSCRSCQSFCGNWEAVAWKLLAQL